MRLSQREFRAMNSSLRRIFQRLVEYPNFRRMGMRAEGGDILEIGCGSGYGAQLLARLHPRSYEGVDLMSEQIELAQKAAHRRGLDGYVFRTADATRLDDVADQSKDMVVIFGVLHHIPAWRGVISECARVLRVGGQLFLEEPDGVLLAKLEPLLRLGHPAQDALSLGEIEQALAGNGLVVSRRLRVPGFGIFAATKQIEFTK